MDSVSIAESISREKHNLSIHSKYNKSKPYKFYSSINIEEESKNDSISKDNIFKSKKNVILEIQEEKKEDEKEIEEEEKEEEKEKDKKEEKEKKEKNFEKNEELIGQGGFIKVYKSNIMIENAKKIINNNKDLYKKEIYDLQISNNSKYINDIIKLYERDDKNSNLYLKFDVDFEGNLEQLRDKIIKKYNNKFLFFIIQNIMKQLYNIFYKNCYGLKNKIM